MNAESIRYYRYGFPTADLSHAVWRGAGVQLTW